MRPFELSDPDKGSARVCARLLGLADPLIRVARASAMVVLAALALGRPFSGHELLYGVGVAQYIAWAAAEWSAGRIRLDRALFEDFAQGMLVPAQLDAVLGKPARDMSSRVTGALALLRRLAVCSGAAFFMALGAAGLLLVRGG